VSASALATCSSDSVMIFADEAEVAAAAPTSLPLLLALAPGASWPVAKLCGAASETSNWRSIARVKWIQLTRLQVCLDALVLLDFAIKAGA